MPAEVSFGASFFGSQLTAAAEGGPPKFDIAATCRGIRCDGNIRKVHEGRADSVKANIEN
jgi:hypothetical protein